jgi:hypothetical protein
MRRLAVTCLQSIPARAGEGLGLGVGQWARLAHGRRLSTQSGLRGAQVGRCGVSGNHAAGESPLSSLAGQPSKLRGRLGKRPTRSGKRAVEALLRLQAEGAEAAWKFWKLVSCPAVASPSPRGPCPWPKRRATCSSYPLFNHGRPPRCESRKKQLRAAPCPANPLLATRARNTLPCKLRAKSRHTPSSALVRVHDCQQARRSSSS